MAATLYQSETAPPKVSRPLIRRSFYLPSLPPSITSYLLHPFQPSLLPKCSLPPTLPSSLPPPGSRSGGLDPAALHHGRHPTGRGPERGLAALGRRLAHFLRWQGLLLPPSHAPDGREWSSRPALSSCVGQTGHFWLAGCFSLPLFVSFGAIDSSGHLHRLYRDVSFFARPSYHPSYPLSYRRHYPFLLVLVPPSMAFSFKLTFTDTYQRFPFFSLPPGRAILNLSFASQSRPAGWWRKVRVRQPRPP